MYYIQICLSSGTSRSCLSETNVWLVVALTTVMCIVPSLVVTFLRAVLFPTLADKVHEQ